ncbi:MAG: nucleotidyl transferase AbiEii/AbiGii toxin family protein [Elusimicrobiota bacterium]
MSQDVVLHGGTTIWRCYGGNRFSWDLDFYFPKNFSSNLEDFKARLAKMGVEVKKLKTTENSIYATLTYKNRTIKFGGLFKKPDQAVTKQYRLADGTSLVVKTLSPVNLLEEKVKAYLDRKEIRDLYDIYYLSKLIDKKEKIKPLLSELLQNYQEPKSEEQLESLIIIGVAPNTKDMLNDIKRWVK